MNKLEKIFFESGKTVTAEFRSRKLNLDDFNGEITETYTEVHVSGHFSTSSKSVKEAKMKYMILIDSLDD